ncbi:MAG: carbohydrate ABC transporter permease [Lachnospiraceae bacterium]|nr:carbohydrate ABC transporter permease [Lachnospiraceae bacterium]
MRTGKKKLGRMIRITVSWIVVMIILFPIYWILLTSVRPVDEILAYPPKFLPDLTTASTRHYATVLSGKMGSSTNQYGLPTFFLNSVILSVTTTAVTVFISLFTAYGLVRVRFRGRNLASHLILLCYLVPGIALMIPMFTIAVQLRLNNTLAGVILFQIAMNLPLGIWFVKAFIQGIPESLEEASRLDGCNRIQVIQKIILPLAVPGLVVVGFNTFLSSWNDYLLPSILIDKEGLKPLMVGLYIYFNQNIGIIWGEAMASAVITMIPVFFIFFYFQKYIVGGLSMGAVKG